MEPRTLSRRGLLRRSITVSACLSLAALMSTLMAGAAPARADAPLSGEVLVILAKEAAGPVDPALKKLEALRKAPFNAFKSMKVLDRKALSLKGKQAESAALPNGRKLALEVLEKKADGRFKVKVSITKPDAKKRSPSMVVVAVPGETFFIAGQPHEGGTMIIGIKVGKKAKK